VKHTMIHTIHTMKGHTMKHIILAAVLLTALPAYALDAPLPPARPGKTPARPGKICLITARDHVKSYVNGVCGKGTGPPLEYLCVFSETDSAVCLKDGQCFVCKEGD
jgi:hypothetical protein